MNRYMDAHVHLKNRNDKGMDLPELLQEMDAAEIEKVFLMPSNSTRAENERMLSQVKGHEDRFIPFAFINPYHEDCVEWFRDAVMHRGVKGLKLHPVCDAYPADRAYLLDPLLEICDQHHLHCIIHCTSDAPNSSPLQFERTARRWPNVTFQMAHMGGCWLSDDAIKICGRNENIYLEGSTVSLSAVQRAVSAYPDKFLMGTDVPFYRFEMELLKMKLATSDPAVFTKITRDNMDRLIRERGWKE
jgi:predicted TIM-barrel fold metal-dependent hydrolase